MVMIQDRINDNCFRGKGRKEMEKFRARIEESGWPYEGRAESSPAELMGE